MYVFRFFGSFQGVRKILKLYNPQPPEVNITLASTICMAPLLVVPKLRPMLPYGALMILIDVLNGIE